MVTFVIEASHLFRSGDKFHTQFFVMDVVRYLNRSFYENSANFQVIVLFGSVKDEQAERYTAALERFGVKVVRMSPITSAYGEGRIYFKPSWYLHQMMGTTIPEASDLVLVGFHNIRYQAFLEKYHGKYRLTVAAFTTPSKKQGWMQIPPTFQPFLTHCIDLDQHVAGIKAEFKQKQ